jgi:TRAP-type C4-dicarboxylate transport system permease small subunit
MGPGRWAFFSSLLSSGAPWMLELLSRELNRVAEWVMAALLAALAVLVGAQIAGRFLFGYSIFWSDELARFLLVWSAFLGMSVGMRRGAHPAVDSLVRALPPAGARVALAAGVACSLLFFLVMVGHGALLVQRTWLQHSPSLGLRMGLPYLAVPVAGLLMGLHTIAISVNGALAGKSAGDVDG